MKPFFLTRPAGRRWDPLLWRKWWLPVLSEQRSSPYQPAGKKKQGWLSSKNTKSILGMCISRFLYTDLTIATHHDLFSSKHDVSRSLQPGRVESGQGTVGCATHSRLFMIITRAVTRPGWTPCSSKGCQISAWSPSRWRSWQEHTVCWPSTAGTT